MSSTWLRAFFDTPINLVVTPWPNREHYHLCCSLVESRVRDVEGIKDAAVDIVNMELVVTTDGRRIDLERVIRTIRDAGYDAKVKE